MTATQLPRASGRRRVTNRRRTSAMPYALPGLRRMRRTVPLHRVLPARSLVLLPVLVVLLAAALVVAAR
ncbi:MAG: hypothetical protein V7637_5565 [Mycobacteriales bacterium]|jgi:hypothetical protein